MAMQELTGRTETVVVNGRLLSKPANAELSELFAHERMLFNDQKSPLCQESPINFNGTLLLDYQGTVLRDLYAAEQREIPLRIDTPYTLLPDLEFACGPLRRTAGLVLYKHGVGKPAGIVLQGPYTGLLLDAAQYMETGAPMVANRIFNNEKALPSSFSHGPKFGIAPPGYFHFHGYDPFFDTMLTWYNRKVKEYLEGTSDRYREMGKDLYQADLFIELCRELQLPLDEKEFRWTMDLM